MAGGNAAGSNEKGANAGAPASESGGGGSKLILIVSAVNLVATAGMLAILFISFQRNKKKQSVEQISIQPAAEEAKSEKPKGEGEKGEEGGKEGEKKKPANYGRMVTLDQFTVNLSTPGSVMPKFVRVNISLEVPTADTEDEVNAKLPQVRNVIIDLFNSKRPSDLANVEGREFIKEEIRNAIDNFLSSGKIKGVFFTSFSLAG